MSSYPLVYGRDARRSKHRSHFGLCLGHIQSIGTAPAFEILAEEALMNSVVEQEVDAEHVVSGELPLEANIELSSVRQLEFVPSEQGAEGYTLGVKELVSTGGRIEVERLVQGFQFLVERANGTDRAADRIAVQATVVTPIHRSNRPRRLTVG